jgi:hypothetical protein
MVNADCNYSKSENPQNYKQISVFLSAGLSIISSFQKDYINIGMVFLRESVLQMLQKKKICKTYLNIPCALSYTKVQKL